MSWTRRLGSIAAAIPGVLVLLFLVAPVLAVVPMSFSSASVLELLPANPGWSQYRTPIDGYYQCGSGTHPGGCVMGAPGKLASQQIVSDLKR